MEPIEQMHRPKELAERLSVSERQVHRWIENGVLKAVRVTLSTKRRGTVMIPDSAVRELLARHAVNGYAVEGQPVVIQIGSRRARYDFKSRVFMPAGRAALPAGRK